MNAAAFASSLDRLAHDLRSLPKHVAAVGGQTVMEAALRYSHGPFSTEYLQSLYDPFGPYSKRSPHPPADARMINYQTGLFARSWAQSVSVNFDEIVVSTFNTAPYADELEKGTSVMIARNLPQMVVKTTLPLLAQRAVTALPAMP